MANNDYESSEDLGQPIKLFEFQYGDDDFLRYTDAENAVVLGLDTYTPLAISHEKISSSGKMDDSTLSLNVPLNCPIAEVFRAYPPPRVVALTIRNGNVANPDDPVSFADGENFPVAWIGTVDEGSRSGPVTKLTGSTAAQSLNGPGLRMNYQRPCPHALYWGRCGASKAAATESGTVAAASGVRVTLEPGWEGAREQQSFVGGMVEWTTDLGTESRSIRRVDSGDVLVLAGPVGDLASSDTVSVVLGCRHNVEDCENLHDVIQDYGGHPWIPTENPVYRNNHT